VNLYSALRENTSNSNIKVTVMSKKGRQFLRRK